MTTQTVLRNIWNTTKRAYTVPPRGESGRLVHVGLMGFLTGPIGVGVLLRSWLDTLALLVVLVITDPFLSPLMFWAVCSGWAVGRVVWRDRCDRTHPTAELGTAASQPGSV